MLSHRNLLFDGGGVGENPLGRPARPTSPAGAADAARSWAFGCVIRILIAGASLLI